MVLGCGSRCSHFRAAQEGWHSTERSLGAHAIETYMARIMPPRMLRVPGDQKAHTRSQQCQPMWIHRQLQEHVIGLTWQGSLQTAVKAAQTDLTMWQEEHSSKFTCMIIAVEMRPW